VNHQNPRSAEQWALQVLDGHIRGVRNEDGRVEFKRQLPSDPQKVARRLAGHANAARGEPILWLVGVDEKERKVVPGELPSDAAAYWSQVWSKFDGPHPDLVDVYVDLDGVPVLALAFNCDRVPYVIYTGLDAPRLEVPWREGTRVDSANRSQLIRTVQPIARAPSVEVRHMAVDNSAIAVFFFVVPPNADPLMLPVHRAMLEYGDARMPAHEVTGNNSKLTQPHPVLREANGQGVYLYGPAEVVVKWRLGMNQPPQQCRARLTFEPGSIEVLVTQGMPTR
jgi:hypothetical protein